LLDRTSPRGIVVQDKNADLLRHWRGTSTHNTYYSTRCAVMGVKSSVCYVSSKGKWQPLEPVGRATGYWPITREVPERYFCKPMPSQNIR
jgi:hypothetical protein